ncbi:hypothetical protein F2Q68_00001752 [Brassica cretica]|uniref:PUB 62/63 C-terminal domain-containing protein n=1 Tax=Brassica cretica TaxID=69181 RepID=A0A8S9JF76_BRACR|nr:hypothetical protein F2Q68_00001752 [Brassica cretica]
MVIDFSTNPFKDFLLRLTNQIFVVRKHVSLVPSLLQKALRIVVHAFLQEEESDHVHSLKRRKERSDQHKRTFCVPNITDTPKSSSRGIQCPFSIGDRIIIEGNKRTPPRFVGRKAVIMTHCLNGWYVVKTVDNAESIKLQHCSLAKIADNSPSEVTVAEMAPPWLSSS